MERGDGGDWGCFWGGVNVGIGDDVDEWEMGTDRMHCLDRGKKFKCYVMCVLKQPTRFALLWSSKKHCTSAVVD